MNSSQTSIYIQLLDEGLVTARPAKAINLGNGRYKILMPTNYNPEDEKWEFIPETIVRCEVGQKW